MKPILQALILADHVYTDVTGKHIIAGTFNKLLVMKGAAKPRAVKMAGEERHLVPGGMQAGSPYVYVSLTELRGETDFELRYVNLGQDVALFGTRFSVTCPDPLQTVELVLPMPQLPKEPGVHALELLCGNEPIGSYRIVVEEQEEEDDENDCSD